MFASLRRSRCSPLIYEAPCVDILAKEVSKHCTAASMCSRTGMLAWGNTSHLPQSLSLQTRHPVRAQVTDDNPGEGHMGPG